MFLYEKCAKVVLLILCFNIVSGKPGDRARRVCKWRGTNMVECQRILYNSTKRVPADLLEFPHMALIGFKSADSNGYIWNCGGSLISQSWVLTAAHCLKDPKNGPAKKILVGTTTFEEEEDEDLTQMRDIVKLIGHPDYKPPAKYNDIALLKMNKRIRLGRDIRIACLQTEFNTAKSVIASGFGKTSFDNTVGSKSLMHVHLDLISNEKCNISLKSLCNERGGLKSGILSSQLCAGDLENGGKDTCQGDSGGPLQTLPENPDCKTTFPLYVLLGVTSFGRFCGFKNSPGVYTRVSHYIAWIEDIVWPLKNKKKSKKKEQNI